MDSPTTRRSKIPYDLQVKVFFRDKWICRLCGRPTVFAPALKYLKLFVESKGHTRPTAYYSPAYRRDASPLLDEMAAVVDHVKAHVQGGPDTESNLATACCRCNMIKKAKNPDEHKSKHPRRHIHAQYGEPEHWDGFVSLFMVLAEENMESLTGSERSWYRAFTKFFASESLSPPGSCAGAEDGGVSQVVRVPRGNEGPTMKTDYIETEDDIRRIGHGIEFYHDYVGTDDPVAFLSGFAWLHGKPQSVDVLIRPASSRLLKNREGTPAAIIAEVKEAVVKLLQSHGIPPGGQSSRMTARVSTWLNG